MATGAPLPQTQTAIVQTRRDGGLNKRLSITHSVPVPVLTLTSKYDVLVRVLAVALNPTDHKMVMHFPVPESTIGCDFCGIIVALAPTAQQQGLDSPQSLSSSAADSPADSADFKLGDRICGGLFPYGLNPVDPHNGAFTEYVVVDSRLSLRIPENWSDLQGAALGGIGWATVGLAFCDQDALSLQGRPSAPLAADADGRRNPVLVYGGATATGTMACQLLKLSGYSPIAVTSTTSAPLALAYGAEQTAAYTSPTCTATIRSHSRGVPIRHTLDCITDPLSVEICFGAMSRTGGRYACLEALRQEWRTRRSVKTKEVMAYEGLGIRCDMGDSPYTREANRTLFDLTAQWAREMQTLLDNGLIRTHPIREIPGRWEGILDGLAMLLEGGVRGQKLVVKIADQ